MKRMDGNHKWSHTWLIKMVVHVMIVAAATLIGIEARASAADSSSKGSLHAFYPTNAVFSEQIKSYMDDADSISFAWSRIDAENPDIINGTKGLNGNQSFYYPSDYIEPIKYAKAQGKTIQLNIYMDQSDGILLLPYADKREAMIQGILQSLTTETAQGNGIYFDGVVIDFEGLRNTDSMGNQILHEGKSISFWFNQFLTELRTELEPLSKTLYVAVNPGQYYDGYDYAAIIDTADQVILMAHDYEPTQALQKYQVQQYTGYDVIEPLNSMAPILMIREALMEISEAVTDDTALAKVWLQITFDTAQWRFNADSKAAWEKLPSSTMSREGRLTPLYKSVKARVDNADGYGVGITYGYNNELQTPYIEYFNSSDKSWNVILYEDSTSISAKIMLAEDFGLGGISLWSLANVPDYDDATGMKYHLDGWTTITEQMSVFGQDTEADAAIIFKDTAVEQAVRDKLMKPEGSITLSDVKSIYRLKLPQGVKSLTDLTKLTNLEYLDAQQLGIKSITPLTKLTNLRVLYLQQNQISDLSPLKALTKLRKLVLNNNKITDITALKKLTNLETLYLQRNSISSITALSGLKKLTLLSLNGNQIVYLKSISKLTALEKLYLRENKITSVAALQSLSNLKELYLSGNKITNYSLLKSIYQKTGFSCDFVM